MSKMGNIEKTLKELDKMSQRIENEKKRNQGLCDHQKKGEAFLRPTTNNEGKQAYQCIKCNKIIAKKAPSVDDVMAAIATLETASDYMKFQIDSTTEDGKKKLKYHADYNMENLRFAKAYCKIKKEKQKQAEMKRKNQNGKHANAYFNA